MHELEQETTSPTEPQTGQDTLADHLIVVSDIHLQSLDDSRGRLFLEVLTRLDLSRVRYLVLLGDIFDFCFGASPYFREKFRALGTALEGLADKGLKIYFVQGNHEFSLDELAWKGVSCRAELDFTLSLDTGLRLAFTHGDRLGAPWHYHAYAWLTRTRLFRRLGLLCSQAALDRFCLALSHKSRDYSTAKKLPHRKIIGAMHRWLDTTGCDYGVVGHFHVPYCLPRHGSRRGSLLCLPSWEQPNVLGFTAGVFTRYYFTEPGGPFHKKTLKAKN